MHKDPGIGISRNYEGSTSEKTENNHSDIDFHPQKKLHSYESLRIDFQIHIRSNLGTQHWDGIFERSKVAFPQHTHG